MTNENIPPTENRKILGDARISRNLSGPNFSFKPNVISGKTAQIGQPERLGNSNNPQDAYEFDFEIYQFLKK